MSQPGDPEVNVSASDRAALGSFRSIHPAGSSMHRTNITILSVFTLLLAGPAVACVIIALFRKPGTGFFITAAVLGVVALLPAVVLYLQIRKLRWRLYLFDNGFVFARGTDRAIRWTDVKSFYEWRSVAGYRQADLNVRFILEDGARFSMDSSFKDMVAFTEAVRDGVNKMVLARASAALSSGQAVAFGKLLLSQAGLEKDGELVPWGDVHSIGMEERLFRSRFHAYGVVLYRRSPKSKSGKAEWHVRAAPEFPNVAAFLTLASRFTTVSDPNAGSR